MCKAQGKPCIAYGSEVGKLDPVIEKTSKKQCDKVLFIARSTGSFDRCQELGFTCLLGTDTAWDFDSSAYAPEAERILRTQGRNGTQRLIGVAPINPFWWPVKPSLSKLLAHKLGSTSARDMGLNEKLIMRVDDKDLTNHLLEAWDYAQSHTHECIHLMLTYRLRCLDALEQMLDTFDSTVSSTYPSWKDICHANQ